MSFCLVEIARSPDSMCPFGKPELAVVPPG